jgi:membrane-associated protease RseP (regulator of RpoE activity)
MSADPRQPPLAHQPQVIIVDVSTHARTVSPTPVRRWKMPLFLYVATWLTTWYAGILYSSVRAGWTELLLDALRYAVPVMLILTAHELGHFLQAVRYGVPASFPWFIPMPPVLFGTLLNPFGTMGAVIVQRSGVATRKQMFDIAITGPLAGLVVTIPVVLWGLSESRIEAFPLDAQGFRFGDPLLLRWLATWFVGPLGPNEDYILNPPLMAGWVGIFITALNLFPVGQLDGGHILYCLLGPPARRVTRTLYHLLVAVVLLGGLFFEPRYMSWLLMLLLLRMGGVEHPPTANDREPLGPVRIFLGWLTLGFVVIGFTPIPIL